MTALDTLNILLGRRIERADPLLVAPGDLPATAHGTAWLVQLRWVAFFGQLGTIAFVGYVLGITLPMAPMFTVVAVTGISNAALALWSATRTFRDLPSMKSQTVPILGLVELLDLILLTVLLSYSGGPTNPFLVFYFVNLSLCAIVLPRAWAWVVSGAAIVCFTVMLLVYVPLPEVWISHHVSPIVPGRPLTRAQWGSLIAFATCDIVIVYFTSILRDQLRKRGRQLQGMQEDAARVRKLEALGTLAAGAAHELANPLGTIAVVVREIERRVVGSTADPRIVKDFALIRAEIETCRNLLKRMNANAGQTMGEELVEATARELLEESLEGLQDAERVTIVIDDEAATRPLMIPLVGLAQAIRGLVQNALAASASVQPVQLSASKVDDCVRIVIRDEGVGMHPRVLSRVGDPFFTTKEPGSGTGLGVFLARAVVQRLGGSLSIDSTSGRGTTVTIVLPSAII